MANAAEIIKELSRDNALLEVKVEQLTKTIEELRTKIEELSAAAK